MTRIFQALTIASMGALLGLSCGLDAFAQTARSKPAPRPSAADAPSVVSVLRMAVDLAEGAHHEAVRLPLRYRVAVAIKKTHQELAFGSYAHDSISFWGEWNPMHTWIDRDLQRRHRSIEAEAKKVLLSGDQERAKLLLDERGCKPPIINCAHPNVDVLFLHWEIESGDLKAATHRLTTTDWKSMVGTVETTRYVAKAYFDAGQRKDGLELLAGLRSVPGVNDSMVAGYLWQVGAIDEARNLMREAATKSLEDVARIPSKGLPGHIPALQWAMGDKEGATETLRRLQQFENERVREVRAPLAGALSLFGRDTEATAYLEGTIADRVTLAHIVVGQARRGDFDAAFRTLDRLRGLVLPPMEDTALIPGSMMAVVAIERIAARTGKVAAFEKADGIRRALNPASAKRWQVSHGQRAEQYPVTLNPRDGPRIVYSSFSTNNPSTPVLADLARTGHAKLAVEYALLTEDRSEKIQALCTVAEGLAGLAVGPYNPLAFFEAW